MLYVPQHPNPIYFLYYKHTRTTMVNVASHNLRFHSRATFSSGFAYKAWRRASVTTFSLLLSYWQNVEADVVCNLNGLWQVKAERKASRIHIYEREKYTLQLDIFWQEIREKTRNVEKKSLKGSSSPS